MEYASSSWNGWISETHHKKLQVIQNEALTSMAGLAKTCPIDFLRLETGVEPIAEKLDKNDNITWDRYKRLPLTDARRQLVEKDIPARLKTRKGFRARTKEMFQFHSIKRDISTPPLEPWLEFSNLKFESVQLEKRKDEYEKEELNRLANEKISSLGIDIRIYTDGSTNGQQRN